MFVFTLQHIKHEFTVRQGFHLTFFASGESAKIGTHS